MQKKIILFASLLFIFLMTACGKENPPPQSENDSEQAKPLHSFLPLSPGSTWEYAGYGNEYASYNAKALFQKGDKYQVMKDNGGTVVAQIYKVTDEQISIVYREEEVYDERNLLDAKPNCEIVILKQPLKKGNTWSSDRRTWEITETDASISTPAGKFDHCILVKTTSETDEFETYTYFKQGVGIVKEVFKGPDFEVSSSLKNYKIQ